MRGRGMFHVLMHANDVALRRSNLFARG